MLIMYVKIALVFFCKIMVVPNVDVKVVIFVCLLSDITIAREVIDTYVPIICQSMLVFQFELHPRSSKENLLNVPNPYIRQLGACVLPQCKIWLLEHARLEPAWHRLSSHGNFFTNIITDYNWLLILLRRLIVIDYIQKVVNNRSTQVDKPRPMPAQMTVCMRTYHYTWMFPTYAYAFVFFFGTLNPVDQKNLEHIALC